MKGFFQRYPLLTALPLVLFLPTVWAATNVPPAVVVLSAQQRPGTTFMDIDFRVNDPDDAFVETSALGFMNGGNSLSNVIKINTLVEGTDANLGPNTPANTPLRLTWNVAADWNTNFGNVQVEILAKDSRGLLPFHWITLPSNGPNPEVAINHTPVYDTDLLPLWYWFIAQGDANLQLVEGHLYGVGGDYNSHLLANAGSTTIIGREFLWQRLNIHSVSQSDITRANFGRFGFSSVNYNSVAKGFVKPNRIIGWGRNIELLGMLPQHPPNYNINIRGIAVTSVWGYGHVWVLSDVGIVWNSSFTPTPDGVAVATGDAFTLFLRKDGTVEMFPYDSMGVRNVPSSVTNVVAIAAGGKNGLALRADGSIVGWYAWEEYGPYLLTVPSDATNCTAVTAGKGHFLALRQDDKIVAWGDNSSGQTSVPAVATNVVAIAAGGYHSLALRADGRVVAWGNNQYGQTDVPTTLTNATAITAGLNHSVARRADGTVVVWGNNDYGQVNVPSGLSNVDVLCVGSGADFVVVAGKEGP